MSWAIHNGDCLEVLRTLADCSVDAVVTDPPYGLSFMGKRWDYDVPSVDVWAECLRVLKPGGHLLAFAGTRTQHRMAVRIEDAGFEIRDMIAWVYGSGFPKSLDVSKAIDKAAGAEREVVGVKENSFGRKPGGGDGWGEAIEGGKASDHVFIITAPATDAARQWHGWGTALKPAMEPITVARKPLAGTVAENVLAHGTGAMNIDGCRVRCSGESLRGGGVGTRSDGWDRPWKADASAVAAHKAKCDANADRASTLGRWPANLIHDGSEEPTKLLGDAARFFYCAKASKADRDEGLDAGSRRAAGVGDERPSGSSNERRGKKAVQPRANIHPTVKPVELMRYLCRLVTPPSGIVLDPFTGSGSTGKAAILESFNFIGIEREAEYCEIARARISKAEREIMGQLDLE